MINRETFKLSVIIPCFNEKNTINIILNKIIESLKNYKILNYEIIIIDDCSNDGTRELLNKIQDPKIKIFFHDRNQGKGGAIQTAIKKITGELIIIQDADLEYDPFDYNKIIAKRVIPDPIPNSEVKPFCADGTLS